MKLISENELRERYAEVIAQLKVLQQQEATLVKAFRKMARGENVTEEDVKWPQED